MLDLPFSVRASRMLVVACLVYPAGVHLIGVDQALPETAQAAYARIRDEGLSRSRVMDSATELIDGVGPRLTGSRDLKKAIDWAREQLPQMGLSQVRAESWGEFVVGWEQPLLTRKLPVRVEVNGDAAFTGDREEGFNVLVEIPGVDPVRKDQVVMAGALLDSRAAGPPLSVATLVELAKKGPALTRPPETRQSYPIPVLDGPTLRCAFLYAPQGRANAVEGLHLLAPTHLAWLDAETGRFESIREVRPAEFGQADAPGDDIGAHRMPAGLTVETFYPQQARLFAAYDALLPAFAARQRQFSREVRRAAAEFRRLFPWLAENPLMPYYRSVGKEFFTWVDRIPSESP